MKKFTLLILSTLLTSVGFAQLTTPNNGENYNLSELSALDPSILSYDGTKYTLSDDLTIAENDTLQITDADTLLIDTDKRITIEGSFIIDASSVNNPFYLSSTDSLNPADGLRFEEFSFGSIKNAEISYTGGIKVMSEEFLIQNSYLAYNVSGVSTGATISFSRGAPLIQDNTFYKNDLPAVSSGANQSVAAQIIGNHIEKNGQSNQNRPQINMGPTGTDTLKIINNSILGDLNMTKVGGIGVANFVGMNINAVLKDNVIRNNRYGLTIAGPNAETLIEGNIIEDNNTDNNPATSGSGISLNSSSGSQNNVVRQNKIRRNLWGITVIGKASIDLGTTNDLGHNLFSENGNGGDIYAIYNNTSLDHSAMGNCWIEENPNADSLAIEDVVFHQNDDSSLGTIDFSNWTCGTLASTNFEVEETNIYPNPANDFVNIHNSADFEMAKIYNSKGELLKTEKLQKGENAIDLELPNGLYVIKLSNASKVVSKKLIVQ